MQSYKTAMCFITSWIFLYIRGEKVTFTYMGIISAMFWVPGGVATIYAIKTAGLAIGIGVGSSFIVLVSFSWGIFFFDEHVHSRFQACSAVACMLCGLAGMAYYSAPTVAHATHNSNSTTTEDGTIIDDAYYQPMRQEDPDFLPLDDDDDDDDNSFGRSYIAMETTTTSFDENNDEDDVDDNIDDDGNSNNNNNNNNNNTMNSEKSSNSNSNRSSLASSSSTSKLEVFVNPATVALKLLVLWIYIDAGWENISIRNKDGRMPWFPYPRWIPIVAIRWVHNTSIVSSVRPVCASSHRWWCTPKSCVSPSLPSVPIIICAHRAIDDTTTTSCG
mmetsp:Transcript_40567/g.45691  ORF Transcript_40567/g.45691 Transcript_40567/m.45691 type:complete len:331 (+) Transcript_40567:339-1331(+)